MRRRMSASEAAEGAADPPLLAPFAPLEPDFAADGCRAARGCRASGRGESSSTLSSMPLDASPEIQ